MQTNRLLLWLCVICLVLSGVHVLMSVKGGASRAIVARTHLLTEPVHSVTSLTFTCASETGQVFRLEKRNKWRITEPFVSFADGQAVLRLLDALTTGEIQGSYAISELSRLGKSTADFGLTIPKVECQLGMPSGNLVLRLGSPTPTGVGSFMTINDEDLVYIAPTNVVALLDRSLFSYRLRSLFVEPITDVSSFDVRRGKADLIRVFSRDNEWFCQTVNTSGAGPLARASDSRIQEFLTALSTAQATDFVWPLGLANEQSVVSPSLLAGYGLEADSAATVTFKGFDGVDRQVSFGNEAAEETVYALAHNSRLIVTVPAKLGRLARSMDFTDHRLFPITPSKIGYLAIKDNTTTYLLSRDSKGQWMIDAPVVAPADKSVVDTLLAQIVTLTAADRQTEGGLEVALSANTRAEKVDPKRVLMGVRLEGLRSRDMLSIPSNVVRRLVLTDNRAKTSTSIVRDTQLKWDIEQNTSVGGHVDLALLQAKLAILSDLKAEWIVKLKVAASELREYGLEDPAWTLGIDQERVDTVRRNILIGDRAQGGYFATIGSAEAVFVLSDDVVQTLVKNPIQKELKENKNEVR